MAKSTNCKVTCPFTQKACTDCAIYRGRHHYLVFSGSGNGADQTKELIETYFKGMEKGSNPWGGENDDFQGNLNPEVLMKLMDLEN